MTTIANTPDAATFGPTHQPSPDQATAVLVSAQKGGVAKSTSTVCIGTELARLGLNVGIIDFAPNAAATNTLLTATGRPTVADMIQKRIDGEKPSAADYFTDADDVWQPDPTRTWADGGALDPQRLGHLSLLPGSQRLQMAADTASKSTKFMWPKILNTAMLGVGRTFDLVIIDSDPQAGPVQIMAAAAAGWMMTPVIPEGLAVNNLEQTLGFADEVIEEGSEIGMSMQFVGVLVSRFRRANPDEPSRQIRRIATILTDHAPGVATGTFTQTGPLGTVTGGGLFPQVIPEVSAVTQVGSQRKPLANDTSPNGRQARELYARAGVQLMAVCNPPAAAKLADLIGSNSPLAPTPSASDLPTVPTSPKGDQS